MILTQHGHAATTVENVPHALQLLDQHKREVQAFYDDPMTQEMGVPVGDFQEGFDQKKKQLLAFLINNAHGVIKWDAEAEMEEFMP